SFAGSKLPTYVLPAFPPLCLALGCFVANAGWHRSRWFIGLVAASWLGLAAFHFAVLPVYARDQSPVQNADEMQGLCGDLNVPVVCFPRNVDSVAFLTGRADFKAYRSKDIGELIQALQRHPRTVVLFGHRNSPETLQRHLPPHLRMVDRRPMGECEI